MCLSNVYVCENGREELVSESVCNVFLDGKDITLCDIIGQTTRGRGTIQNVDLLKNKILIQAEDAGAGQDVCEDPNA